MLCEVNAEVSGHVFERLKHWRRALSIGSSPLISAAVLLSYCLQGTWALAQTLNWDEYVTGMIVVGKAGAGSSCPPIVWIVKPDSPAAKAGIKPGDRLVAIDGHHDLDILQAQPLLHTKEPKPTTIELEGDHGSYTVEVRRIKASEISKREGLKPGPDGSLFPSDASEAEMQRVSAIESEPPRDRKVFNVGHYPDDLNLYYPGMGYLLHSGSPNILGSLVATMSSSAPPNWRPGGLLLPRQAPYAEQGHFAKSDCWSAA